MFPERLVSIMKERKITRKQFCADVGIGINQIKYWENNNNIPDGEVLNRISSYLDVTIAYLLEYVDDPDPFALIDPTKKDPPMLEAFKEAFAVAEEEAELINLFRQVPKESRPMVLAAIKVAIEATKKKE